jgi:ubiquinone biosynthesis O-methyltransferase
VAKRLLVADTSNATTSAVGLPESYRRWRESRLGQITDALEERLLLDLLGPVRGLSVLDVGCGDGVLASALARRGARVTGLDTDPQMLAAAHHRAKSESIELRLVRGRAEALPFEGETFDRVVAVTVLCFVRETDRAISEIARILKPGGRLVIGELGRWSLWAAIRRAKGWFGAPTWKAVRFHTAKELRSLLGARGLNVDRTVGAIYYPPIGTAALLLGRFDAWCARWTSIGAAFIAVLASKRGAERAVTPDRQRSPSRTARK